jgi:hypothetical protein
MSSTSVQDQNATVHEYLWGKYVQSDSEAAVNGEFYTAFGGVSVSFWKCADVPLECQWEHERDRGASYFDGMAPVTGASCTPSVMRLHPGGRMTHVGNNSGYNGCYDIVLRNPGAGYSTDTGDLIVAVTLLITPSLSDGSCTDTAITSRTAESGPGAVFMKFHTFPTAEGYAYFETYSQELETRPYTNPWVLRNAADSLWAQQSTDTDTTTLTNAELYARKARESAAAAKESDGTATNSKDAAAGSAVVAGASAREAAKSKEDASASEGDAKKHNSDAKASASKSDDRAVEADASATRATESQNQAARSQAAALTSATDAREAAELAVQNNISSKEVKNARDAAASSATEAATSATAAETAKRNTRGMMDSVYAAKQDAIQAKNAAISARDEAQRRAVTSNASATRAATSAATAQSANMSAAVSAGRAEASARSLQDATRVSVRFLGFLAAATCLLALVIYYYYTNKKACRHDDI